VELATGQVVACPDGPIDEGFVFNLCTTDSCLGGQCSYQDKETDGSCDDSNPATVDSCDPSTGECVNETCVPDCEPHTYCWGATEAEAEKMCDDQDVCTLDWCEFGPGFAPFPTGVYLCIHELTLEDCDDGDPCTIDACDPDTGCHNQPDPESGNCLPCQGDEGCMTPEPDPCTSHYCDPDFAVCLQSPLDCDDGNPCTDDSCFAQDGGCVHVPLDGVSCEGTEFAVGLCTAGECICVPQCGPKVCGDDGCGGSCGACDDPCCSICSQQGKCVSCIPDCEGKECGSDGCFGICGSCGDDAKCVPGGECIPKELLQSEPILSFLEPVNNVYLDQVEPETTVSASLNVVDWGSYPAAGKSVNCFVDGVAAGTSEGLTVQFPDVPLGMHSLCCELLQDGVKLGNCEATACVTVKVTRS